MLKCQVTLWRNASFGASIPSVSLLDGVDWALRLSETKKAEYQEMAQQQKEEPLDCNPLQVGGDWNMTSFPIGNFIIPIDELIFFREVGIQQSILKN